jgi:hypothetical protein
MRCSGQNRLRGGTIFYNDFKAICPVQSFRQIFFAFAVGQIKTKTVAILSREEGRWPSSQTLGQVAVDAAASGVWCVRRAVFRE